MSPTEPVYIRRYTELPQAIHMLKTRSLTLLDPHKWDDRNDGELIEKYRLKNSLSKVLALCFTEASETYHHWKIYGGGVSGVCVEFNKEKLITSIPKEKSFKHGPVKYIDIDKLASYQNQASKWPFLKRHAFFGEEEYRFIYNIEDTKEVSAHQLTFDLNSINRIYLSPWIHRDTAASVAEMIRYLPQCSGISVIRTTLVSNQKWNKAITAPKPKA